MVNKLENLLANYWSMVYSAKLELQSEEQLVEEVPEVVQKVVPEVVPEVAQGHLVLIEHLILRSWKVLLFVQLEVLRPFLLKYLKNLFDFVFLFWKILKQVDLEIWKLLLENLRVLKLMEVFLVLF